MDDLDKTISPETMPFPAANLHDTLDDDFATEEPNPPEAFVPASRKAFPPVDLAAAGATVLSADRANVIESKLDVAPAPPAREVGGKSGIERTMTRFFLLVLVAGALAAAFYAGRKYKGPIPYLDPNTAALAQPSPTPVVGDDPLLKFERSRREVDNDPQRLARDSVADRTDAAGSSESSGLERRRVSLSLWPRVTASRRT